MTTAITRLGSTMIISTTTTTTTTTTDACARYWGKRHRGLSASRDRLFTTRERLCLFERVIQNITFRTTRLDQMTGVLLVAFGCRSTCRSSRHPARRSCSGGSSRCCSNDTTVITAQNHARRISTAPALLVLSFLLLNPSCCCWWWWCSCCVSSSSTRRNSCSCRCTAGVTFNCFFEYIIEDVTFSTTRLDLDTRFRPKPSCCPCGTCTTSTQRRRHRSNGRTRLHRLRCSRHHHDHRCTCRQVLFNETVVAVDGILMMLEFRVRLLFRTHTPNTQRVRDLFFQQQVGGIITTSELFDIFTNVV
mmetsp:Transcript_23843/g.56290  ORF Transcript_23843/g.56290 Transcript_23843/m.56290 type:complete len:304 (-) Transcript_23843:282-1193(-)